MTGDWRTIRRMMILGVVVTAFCLVDGLVLLFTNGLGGDAGPVFPWLGGVFSKNRSSGAGLLIIAAAAALVLVVGWFTYARRVRAAALASTPTAAAGAAVVTSAAGGALRGDR